jgi:peptidoglycan hydrolase-like protein with peptidoglycan-binding domain
MTGPFVSRLQGLLVADGYQLGATGPHRDGIDGDFGPLTQSAVVVLQTAAHIAVDGIVGQQTWPVALGVA